MSELKPLEDRLVFIGGLHRSGTSPLARWLATHPDVSSLTDTGVSEDEGQHLQSVYPVAAAHGGAGRFGLDPGARLTEDSPLVTADAAQRLLDAWTPYWDTSKAVLLEKSPPNLVRMRFLRALFPRARFIVLIRHPIAVSMATIKWSDTGTLDSLMRNWLAGHEHLVEDARRVGGVVVVRYEDLTNDVPRELARIFSFLSLSPHAADWSVRGGLNDAYFERFRRSWQRWQRDRLARRYQEHVKPFGYDLFELAHLRRPAPELAELMSAPLAFRSES